MSRRSATDVDRRNLLRGGGALAAGVIGAGAAVTLGASPAAAATGVFTPVVPYRCYDSRLDSYGKMRAGYGIDVAANTDIGRNTRFETTAVAVTFNLTVTETESRGYLAVYPGDTTTAGVLSTLNWFSTGADVANGGVVALGTSTRSGPASVLVYLGGMTNAKAHLLIDITGYYS